MVVDLEPGLTLGQQFIDEPWRGVGRAGVGKSYSCTLSNSAMAFPAGSRNIACQSAPSTIGVRRLDHLAAVLDHGSQCVSMLSTSIDGNKPGSRDGSRPRTNSPPTWPARIDKPNVARLRWITFRRHRGVSIDGPAEDFLIEARRSVQVGCRVSGGS